MSDFIVDSKPFETPINAADQGYANISPPWGRAILSMAEESSPLAALSRAGQRGQFEGSSVFDRAMYDTLTTDPNTGMPVDPNAPISGSIKTPMLEPDEANKLYAPEGTKITDKPIPEGIAKLVGTEKARQIDRESIISRFQNNHNFLTNFGVGMTGFLMDPLNLATMFVPGIGEETAAAGAARVGLTGFAARTATRVISGAATGALAQSPLVALKYGLSQEDASGYDLKSAFRDLFYNAAGAAIFSAGLGAIGDMLGGRAETRPVPESGNIPPAESALRQRLLSSTALTSPDSDISAIVNADAPTKHTAMSTAISQIVEGRPVDVMPIFNERDLRLLTEESQLTNRDIALQQSLSGVDVESARAASKTLDRLNAVESQLSNEGLAPETRRTLMTRRDELLSDTTPEALRAAAAPVARERVVTAERSNIASRLEEIRSQRMSQDLEAITSNLPRLPQAQKAIYDNGFAQGIPQGEFDNTMKAIYEPTKVEAPGIEMPNAETIPATAIDRALADAEAGIKALKESGAKLHPEDAAEIAASENGITKAESMFDTFKAAALCLGGLL